MMQNNIKKLNLIAILEGLVFYYAFDKIFMQARGLSLTEIVILGIILSVTILLFEIPSGALSDRWSRKKVLALGNIFFAANISIWAISNDFAFFAIGMVFGAIKIALRSGTDSSLLFDTLKELNRTNEYEKFLGRKRALNGLSFILSGTIGGYIGFQFGLESAFWLSLPGVLLAALLALTLKEPKFHRSTNEVSFFTHIRETFHFLLKKPAFLHIAIMLTVIMVPILILDDYVQLLYAFIGIGALGLGALASIRGFVDALMNAVAFKFARFSHNILFGVCFLIMGACFTAAGYLGNWISVPLLFVGATTFFIVDVIAMADVNRQIPSRIRATSESVFSSLSNILLIPVALGFAFVSQTQTIALGFMSLGGFVLLYAIFYWVFSFKHITTYGKVKATT